jgi:hypothetical protein
MCNRVNQPFVCGDKLTLTLDTQRDIEHVIHSVNNKLIHQRARSSCRISVLSVITP